jgi:hypothetical protein
MQQVERRRDGEIFVLEAHSWDARYLEPLRRQWPRAYIQWERDGVPVWDESGAVRSSGPAYALWRPAALTPSPGAPLEFDDPAVWLWAPEREADAPEPMAPPEQAELAAPEPPRPARGPRGGRPPRAFKSTRHKSITRVERPERKMRGFHVRVAWQGKHYQKWFSDERHGDRLGALAAAIAWRDATERTLGKPRSERMIVTRSRSPSGHVGVARVTQRGHSYYRALWRDADGQMRRRFFNIARLGERRALRAAIRARAEGEARRLSLR